MRPCPHGLPWNIGSYMVKHISNERKNYFIMKKTIIESFFKIWYWYISTKDKDGDITFMNYGHSDGNHLLPLPKHQEKDRYSIQLYHHLASKINLHDKNLLEVGCGRAGGLTYVKENLLPGKVTGIDLNSKAITFCKTFHCQKNAEYFQADAQSLPFSDHSFDIVMNVESSHRYPRPDLFFHEVNRVLKPGGYFLFTDFRLHDKVEALEAQFREAQLITEEKKDITENVLEALTLATPEREKLIKKIAPVFLHGLAKQFAATTGTPTFNKFLNRDFLYLTYVLRK